MCINLNYTYPKMKITPATYQKILAWEVRWFNNLQSLKGKWRKLFFDHYFSLVPLMKLQVNHIFGCATITPTRKDVPVMAVDNSFKRGDFDYRSTPAGITVYKEHDNRPVHFISNCHNPTVTIVKRKQKDGSKLVMASPEVVKHYNETGEGVCE